MDTIDLVQGDETWHAHRAKHLNASDAPAMMGVSKYKTRSQLIKEMAAGLTQEPSRFTQRLFAEGHAWEALARSLAEQIIGKELFQKVGVNGRYSASFDGLTMDNSIAYEHKTLNNEIRACQEAADLPLMYRVQMEHQLMVCDGAKCLFLASTWSENNELLEQIHFWYTPDMELRSQIIAGWKQFIEDMENYQHIAESTAIIVAPLDELPALTVELVGQVTSSNLAVFKSAALARIESINTDLQTDEDFAIAKRTVKFLDDGEKRLVLVKQQALSQTASIDELFRTMDALREEMKAKRLTLDKLVTAREASIKIEIMQAGKDALAVHIATLNKRLATVQMPPIVADFATAIKGKRNLESMRGAIDDLVAAKKIESNAIADRVQINLAILDDAKEHGFLFSDRSALVMKESDDLALIIKSRIADHKASEEKRLEAERTRIRQEEEAKARKAEADRRAEEEAKARRVVAAPLSDARAPQETEKSASKAENVNDDPETGSHIKKAIMIMLDSMKNSELETVAEFVAALQRADARATKWQN